MKAVNSFFLSLATLFLFGSAELSEAQTVMQMVESSVLEISESSFLPTQLVPGSLRHTGGAEHGEITPQPTFSTARGKSHAKRYDYAPDDDFSGIERLKFTGVPIHGGRSVELEVEVQVLPAALPVAGRFLPGFGEIIGIYHTKDRVFDLCYESLLFGDLLCFRVPVSGLSGYLMPVVGDWAGNGMHVPSLFDPATATLHRLVWSADHKSLKRLDKRIYPGMEHTFPVAGDFRLGGNDELLLVNTKGEAYVMPSLFGGQLPAMDESYQRYGSQLPVPGGDALPWPVRWWQNQDPNQLDGVALVDWPLGLVSWMSVRADDTEKRGTLSILPSRGHLVPLVTLPTFLGWGHLFYLEARTWTSPVSYLLDHWTDSHPTTMPLKFPHEPPDL